MAEETKQISCGVSNILSSGSHDDIPNLTHITNMVTIHTDPANPRNPPEKLIYIKHTDSDKIWSVPADAANISPLLKRNILDRIDSDTYGLSDKNPLIINDINANAIPFIISYLLLCRGRREREPPEQPLKNIHMSVLLGDEFPLFEDLCDCDLNHLEKISKINSILEAAEYFGMDILAEKLCAIIASIFIKNMSLNDFKKIIGDL